MMSLFFLIIGNETRTYLSISWNLLMWIEVTKIILGKYVSAITSTTSNVTNWRYIGMISMMQLFSLIIANEA